MRTEITKAPVAQTEMLIRKPVVDVFEAFIDPDVTTNFWFTKSSGRLEVGREIRWDWEMYGASTSVLVKAIEPNKRIVIEWDGYSGRTTVEWKFSAREDATTYVVITESGWTGDRDELVSYVVESTQGFTWTLAGLKAFLEHGIRLNLVAEKTQMRTKMAGSSRPNNSFKATPLCGSVHGRGATRYRHRNQPPPRRTH